MPAPLPGFASKEELDRWFLETFPDVNNRTYSASYFNGLPDSTNYIYEVSKQVTLGGKDAWISHFSFDGLRCAPPIKEQAWLMNRTFFERALIHVTTEAAKPTSSFSYLLERYSTYLPTGSTCTDAEVIEHYRVACKEFRVALGLAEPNSDGDPVWVGGYQD